MSKTPQYPIEQGEDAALDKPAKREPPPDDLYRIPSFKHRHEIREPLENGEASYRRAHPQFYAPLPRRSLRRRG